MTRVEAKCCHFSASGLNSVHHLTTERRWPPRESHNKCFLSPREPRSHLALKRKTLQWKNTYLETWASHWALTFCVCKALTGLTGAWYFTHGNDALTQPSVSHSLPGCPSLSQKEYKKWKKSQKKHVVKRMFFMFGVAGRLACQWGECYGVTHMWLPMH